MTPAVENTGNDHTEHSVGRFSSNGQYQMCSPLWFSDSMKPGCCSPSQQATTPIMKGPMGTEAEDLAVARSKETSTLPHWMDPTRVVGRIAETGPKPETPSPGPSTPMQAPPLPQQKLQPRETPEPYPRVPNSTSVALSLQHTKIVWGAQSLARPLHPSSVPSQDPVQSQKENALFLSSPNLYTQQGSQPSQKGPPSLLSSHHRVGQPPLNRALATLGTPKTPLLNDELQLHLHSKPTQNDDQSRFLGLDRERFLTPKGRPISNAKPEPHELSVDAGLTLGFYPPHHSGLNKTPLGQVNRKWEDDSQNGSHTDASFAPKTPNEGIAFLQLLQGAATDEDSQDCWDQGNGKPVDSQYKQSQNASLERSLSQVQEHFLALRAEHNVNPFTDLSQEHSKKRMKRLPLDQSISSYEARELNLPIDDEDNERNGNFLADNEDSGSSHPLNGSAKIPPQSSREKVLGKVLAKILDLPVPEPKTMVVIETPKRVHNSNPSFLLSRTEASVLEAGQLKSPVLRHMMFTPSSTPGFTSGHSQEPLHCTNGKIMGDLSNSITSRKVTEVQSSMGTPGGEIESRPFGQESVLWPPPPGSKLFTVPAYSPIPTSSQTFSMGEPSLPLTLNFSPIPLGPLISSPKTSTGIASTEEEWGKSLALSATPATSPTEMESSTSEPKLLTYQERFVQLQAFLKKCDEDDQSDLFHALGSLSAVARSGHAVSLENRAMWLSVEEGKEMSRVKSLNIMGRGTNSRGQNELGCTPQGPRLPAFSTPTDLVQQQGLGNSNSPPRMRMLISGDTPALVNMTTPNFV